MTELATSTNAIDDSSTHEVPQLRVHDNGRALWLVTGVVLLAGLGALRVLIGVADTPRVEPKTNAERAQLTPATSTPDEAIHRFRPQTLKEDSTVQPLGVAPVLDDTWPSVPAASWEASDDENNSNMARHPEFLR
ncbi:hypothetical protein [Aeoliella mucimassa]|uniref:Uncharacterized protein n=1 Tax=Aeoliella mucimassa TaxID=2527972 RepID=A0A518ARG8_9BACT|nr:hypothetical protein [Aeoliella mucimassa]QDU57319.1 hypothetical protein Pan181_35340 [Aeoliella mucimassa]